MSEHANQVLQAERAAHLGPYSTKTFLECAAHGTPIAKEHKDKSVQRHT